MKAREVHPRLRHEGCETSDEVQRREAAPLEHDVGGAVAPGRLEVVADIAVLVAASFPPGVRGDPSGWLFGDILAVDRTDLAIIRGGAASLALLVAWRWQRLLLATPSPDLAHASGIDPRREQLLLSIALALLVAVAIKVVGALLITALLIVPGAAARPFSATPERMALLACAIGALSALGGLAAAWYLDTPAGPSIVCTAALAFGLSSVAGLARG